MYAFLSQPLRFEDEELPEVQSRPIASLCEHRNTVQKTYHMSQILAMKRWSVGFCATENNGSCNRFFLEPNQHAHVWGQRSCLPSGCKLKTKREREMPSTHTYSNSILASMKVGSIAGPAARETVCRDRPNSWASPRWECVCIFWNMVMFARLRWPYFMLGRIFIVVLRRKAFARITLFWQGYIILCSYFCSRGLGQCGDNKAWHVPVQDDEEQWVASRNSWRKWAAWWHIECFDGGIRLK